MWIRVKDSEDVWNLIFLISGFGICLMSTESWKSLICKVWGVSLCVCAHACVHACLGGPKVSVFSEISQSSSRQGGKSVGSWDVRCRTFTCPMLPLHLPPSAFHSQEHWGWRRSAGPGPFVAAAGQGAGPPAPRWMGGWLHSQSASWVVATSCANQDTKGQRGRMNNVKLKTWLC